MSLSLKCDNCGEAVADFTLPQRFEDGQGTILAISVEKGQGSLDSCRRCFTNLLVVLATKIAPPEVKIEWKEAGWESVSPKPEIPRL